MSSGVAAVYLARAAFASLGEGGHEDALESQPGGFLHAALDLPDRADLAAQAHLAGEAHVRRDGEVEVGREHGADDRQVHRRVADAQPAGHVEEDVLGAEVEAGALLQHRQEHVEAPGVKARGGALRRAVHGGADQRLHLEEQRARAVQHRRDGGAAQALLVHRD